MSSGVAKDILQREGFIPVGSIDYRIRVESWWHADSAIEIVALPLGSKTLLKGSKSYSMRSITADGVTYARDIGRLQEYLEAHFPELRLAFSYFRDIPASLAQRHIKDKASVETPTTETPTADDLSNIQKQLERERKALASATTLSALDSNQTGLLHTYMNQRIREVRNTVRALEAQSNSQRERLALFDNLQHEYLRNGSAAAFSFSISSNLQLATTPTELRDSLRSIVNELTELHQRQVTQKLGGGKLNIQVAEARDPAIVWIEEWFGGALSPRQLDRLAPEFSLLRESSGQRLMVAPRDDIKVNGHVKEPRKRLGARVVSTLVRRLDDRDMANRADRTVHKSQLPLSIGWLVTSDSCSGDTFKLPLVGANHIYISGATGSGKSYIGRVIVEEALTHKGVGVLVLDPRNQSAGLLCAEDRDEIYERYDEFGIAREKARGFDFEYAAPGFSIGAPVLTDKREYGVGRNIVSFKSMADAERCALFADILDGAFERCAGSESETVRLLVVVEEAHRFTKKRVDESAKSAAARAENGLDRLVREGRKFGLCAMILSQTIRDFSHDSAAIRQNTTTKIFMRNSDREVEYAAGFIGDGKQIISLAPGTGVICHPAIGTATVRVRPPYSKVWEFSESQTRRLVEDENGAARTVSAGAAALLECLSARCSASDGAVNVTELMANSGITSKRRMQGLLGELERAGLVRSRRLRARGNPRVVEPFLSDDRTDPRTNSALNPDGTDEDA